MNYLYKTCDKIVMNFKFFSIIFISTIPFILSLDGDFVFDDSEAIIKNNDVISDSWGKPFFNDFWGTDVTTKFSHKSYRPLTILSFRLNYLISGYKLNARNFKTTNLLCHSLCCIIVWLVFKSIIKTQSSKKSVWHIDVAYISTLLFAVHPIHVEAVSGIVGRADILAAITFFLSIIFHNKAITSGQHVYLFITILLAVMSMLFKENGVTVLGFCICSEIIEYFKKRTLNSKTCTRIIIILLSTVAALYIRWLIMGGTTPEFKSHDNPTAFSNNIFTKIFTFSYIYFLNFLLLVWPQWLCYDWSMGCVPLIENFLDYRLIPAISIHLFALLILSSILCSKHNVNTKRIIIVAVMLLVIPFLPAANIFFPVGFVIAERILYIPSAGFCLLIAIGINNLMTIKGIKTKMIINISYGLFILIFVLKSWHKSYVWQNEYKLFTDGLKVCPLNAKVHYNVAKVADANNQTDWAIFEYKEAIRLYPKYYQAMNNLANLQKTRKQYIEAEKYLKMAINCKRDFPAAWMNLAIVYAALKNYNDSEIAYKTALQLRPNYSDCYYNLGNMFLEINQPNEAKKNWLEALRINPKHVLAWTNLLALLDNRGELKKAMEMIPRVLGELPESPTINFAVANIYGKLNRYEDSEKYFKHAISLFGDRVQAIHYANLGVLYHRWKKYGLAKKNYIRSLEIDPLFSSSLKNLNALQKHSNKDIN